MFTTDYKISMPLSGIATSWVERDNTKVAYLDYDVKKGFNWNLKFYSDEAKKDPIIEVNEKKTDKGKGYEVRDIKSGEILGFWIRKKRFLNLFLKEPYSFDVNGNVSLTSPGEGFFKLLIPGAIRKMMARKVLDGSGNVLATISVQSTLGCGVVKVKYPEGKATDRNTAVAIAVLAAVCGLGDGM